MRRVVMAGDRRWRSASVGRYPTSAWPVAQGRCPVVDLPAACECTDTEVCARHLRRYERQLGELPALLAELDRSARKQTRGGGLVGGSGKGSPAPLPFDPAAADLAREIRRWVTARGEYSFAAGLAWLLRTVPDSAGWPEGVEWLNDVTRRAQRMVLGRQRDRWFAGVCGAELVSVGVAPDFAAGRLVPVAEDAGRCEALLFAESGATVIRCGSCRAEHKPASYRETLLAVAEDQELPLPLILKALPWLAGVGVNPSTARSWRERKLSRRPTFVVSPSGVVRPVRFRRPAQLQPRSVGVDGVELFRVGDVVDLAVASAVRAARRGQKAAG